MRLIGLAVVLAVGLTLPSTAAEAQSSKTPRIGYLGIGNPTPVPSQLEAFRRGLRDLGWVEGQTVTIEYRWAEGIPGQLPALAADLVRLRVDVIVATGTSGIRAAKEATRAIPIVFVVLVDPVATGLVKSLARPGGNLTGLASQFEDLITKQPQLLKEALPKLSLAHARGLRLQPTEVRSSNDFDEAFSAINNGRAGALYTLGDSLFANNRKRIVDFAAKNRLASMFTTRQSVEAGASSSTCFAGARPTWTRSSRAPSQEIYRLSNPPSSTW